MESELTFVAPEGVYSVTEDHKPIPVTHNAPTPTYPTRLSTATVRFPAPKPAAQSLGQLLGGGKDFWKDNARGAAHDGVSVSSSDTPDDAAAAASGSPPPDPPQDRDATPPTPAAGPDPPRGLFGPPAGAPGGGGKRRPLTRPKHNMRTTSSTFITRLQSAEGLARALAAKQGEVTFLFYNSAKNFYWVEAGAKAKEPLARVAFAAHPTCHDVNRATLSHEHLDVIIGFHTGDLIWFDPINSRYARLNKQGRITNSPCTAVRWVPSSPNLFLVSHADGTIIVYDKDRDDGAFVPGGGNGEWNPLDSVFVSIPPWHPAHAAGAGGRGDKDKTTKNPVSHWRVARRSIVDFVFSPDVKYVAAISEDGCLRVIDTLAEQLVDCYAAYFGALTCVAWSPDGRFIITGGQDDLVNIFSPWEQRVIARCQGHSSFLSALAFDDVRCDGRTYRFASVGEDNKLILWDFSSGILHRPKLHAHHHRLSVASTLSLSARRSQALPPDAPAPPAERYHPAPSRTEVAIVQPVLVKPLEADLPTAAAFLPRWLLTATRAGHVRLWIRPLLPPAGSPRRGGSAAGGQDPE
ncbi:WD40-repeat-containing domain protein [Gloeopeniophorella convolvens]|nr:WD40-repeat-containing domain protein [Gloeopeniophorella convolvens]